MPRFDRLAKLRGDTNQDALGAIAKRLEEMKPRAGRDYFTEEDVQRFVGIVKAYINTIKLPVGPRGPIGEKGEKGEKGDRGPAGLDGADGKTPNLDEIIKKVLTKIPKPEEIDKDQLVKDILKELKDVPGDTGLRLTALEKRLIRLGGGGATYVSQLLDVVLNNLVDGQVLTWDAALQKWKNATNAGGSGINRSVFSVAVNTVAGSALITDYVYFVSGTTTITMPTAVGNNNRYTIKNVGVGVVTIDTTGGQTIDGSLTAPMPVQYESLDLISDGSNWNVC